jgi:hypothetical protein
MSDMREEYYSREAIAFHEAGHAVAAWDQRIRVKTATILPGLDNLVAGVIESVVFF